MNISKRTLTHTLLASAIALASSGALAQGKSIGHAQVGAGAATAGSVSGAISHPVSPTLPTQASPRATDAIQTRTDRQIERRNPTTTPTPTPTPTPTVSAAAAADTKVHVAAGNSAGHGRFGRTDAELGIVANSRGQIDFDGDGIITSSENTSSNRVRAALNQGTSGPVFMKIDTDGDKILSADELRAFSAMQQDDDMDDTDE